MKKKYRAIRGLETSREFSDYFGSSAGPSFADLLSAYPPPSEKMAHKGKEKDGFPPNRESTRMGTPTESQLDLHGMTAAQAETKAISFLLTQKQRGRKTIRIITGKGLHSSGPGVLRDIVELVLLDAKEKNIVAEYHWELGEKEKSGAVLVFLR